MTETSPSSQKIHYKTCPACQATELAPRLTARDYTASFENFEIWECLNCNLRFTQNIPFEEEIGAYYQSEEYISHSNTNQGIVNRLYQVVRNYTLKQKRRQIQKISGLKQGSLLDLGCGTGEFLATMKTAGWQVMGLEPDEGARKMAKERWQLEVDDSPRLFDLPSATYDVITMWHVLEHVHRLHENLDTLNRILKDSGTLFVAVPNYQSRDAGHYGEHWAAYDVPRHLYHFAPSTMENLMDAHGFQVVDKKAMPFDAFYVSLLSEKYRHGNMRLFSGFWQGFRSWMNAGGKVEESSSILYVIQKSRP